MAASSLEIENEILTDRNILILPEGQFKTLEPIYQREIEYLKNVFCGIVYTHLDRENLKVSQEQILYITGNCLENLKLLDVEATCAKQIYIIEELSYNYLPSIPTVSLSEVPLIIHGVGVFFRCLFYDKHETPDDLYFSRIKKAHDFQTLTESDKPDLAYRTGIYLTDVVSKDENEDEIEFRLLRCSTNFCGPTDNFREVDKEILNRVNAVLENTFKIPISLNHVLAQIYNNKYVVVNERTLKKEKKAVIKAHSDKTKDIPKNAVIAFVTFYDNLTYKRRSEFDPFDLVYKEDSVLTRLHFKLKDSVSDPHNILQREFSVKLYPGSVFIIPLSTNRLYTHEIRPSVLPISHTPTRMGYVIRCSKTSAVFKEGQTYIKTADSGLVPLHEVTPEDKQKIKELYLLENKYADPVYYPDIFCSLNGGDYKKPIV